MARFSKIQFCTPLKISTLIVYFMKNFNFGNFNWSTGISSTRKHYNWVGNSKIIFERTLWLCQRQLNLETVEPGNFTIDLETSELFWKLISVSKSIVMFPGRLSCLQIESEYQCDQLHKEVSMFKIIKSNNYVTNIIFASE